MKYAFALAAVAGLAAAQPHVGHQRLHKKAAGMQTVTDWTVVTVTDVVTVYGPSPVSEPTQAANPPAPAPSSHAAAPPAPAPSSAAPSSAQAPPAQSPSAQPKPADPPASSAAAPAPASSAAAPASSAAAPAQSSSAPSSGGGSGVGNYGLQPGATTPADCTKDKPCDYGMTTYATGMGACGYDDSPPNDSDVVALQMDMFGSVTNSGVNMPSNKLCNKKIQITNPKTGATAVGTIRDRCQGCTGAGGIDLSPPLWAKLNNNGPGDRVPVEWYFIS